MLSFAYRFHGHGSLRYVYKNGQTVRSRLLTVKYTANPHRKRSRFAVVVSKKVHKGAVGRNRIRRRIYEILRQEIPQMAKPHDIAIIVVSGEILHLPVAELHDTVTQALQQANIYK